MKALDIRELFKNFNDFESKEISINGWVRSNRDSKNFGFLVINDGTFIENLQIVYDNSLENFQEIAKVELAHHHCYRYSCANTKCKTTF